MAARLAVLLGPESVCRSVAETGGVRSSCLAAVDIGVVSGMFVLRRTIALGKDPEGREGRGGLTAGGREHSAGSVRAPHALPSLPTAPVRQGRRCTVHCSCLCDRLSLQLHGVAPVGYSSTPTLGGYKLATMSILRHSRETISQMSDPG